jgi:hypothetical protein
MPSLFRRKSSDLVTDAVDEANTRARPARPAATKSATTKSATTKSTSARTSGVKTTTAKATATKATPTRASGSKATVAAKTTAARTTVSKAAPAKATTLKSSTLDTADDSDTGSRTRGYTPSKKDLGQSTPKRKAGGRVVEAPPANRREAWRRARLKQRENRQEQRAGMLAGKDEFLMKRDRGPERAYVRDIVDSRRNFTSLFMPLALVVIIGTAFSDPTIRFTANIIWYAIALGIVVDGVFLSQRVRRLMRAKFPKDTNKPRSYYFYAIMRALSPRRLRTPAARVQRGEVV